MARGVYLDIKQCKILESIKDGEAKAGKYISRQLNLKKPNVLIVFFSKKEPNQNTFVMDRWTILKISNDLTELTLGESAEMVYECRFYVSRLK